MKGRDGSKYILLSALSMVSSKVQQLFVCSLHDKACPKAWQGQDVNPQQVITSLSKGIGNF